MTPIRIGIIMSIVAHIVFVLWGVLSFANLAALPTPREPITVDLVTPKEFAEASKGEAGGPAPDRPPAGSPAQTSAPQQPAERTREATAMPAWWTQDWVPPVEAAPLANNSTVLSREEIGALHAHLQKCWSQPASIPAEQKLSVTLRVALAPNGALMAEPVLMKASASPHGPAVVGAALQALTRCQPLAVLPAGKYEQWKMLDLTFTPQGLTSG